MMQAKEFVAVNVVRVMLLNVLPISIVLVRNRALIALIQP